MNSISTLISKLSKEENVQRELSVPKTELEVRWFNHVSKVKTLTADYPEVITQAIKKAARNCKVIDKDTYTVIEVDLMTSEKPFRTILEIVEHKEDPLKNTSRYIAFNPYEYSVFIRPLQVILNK